MRPLTLLLLFCACFASNVRADDAGWVSLYNGKDLKNWVNVNCAPDTWTAQGDVIHCTGHPTGALRTPRQYENFILELDWRHLKPAGNSGVFIWGSAIAAPGVPFLRAIEVQVLDNDFNIPGKNEWYTTHGDVFPIHGSHMKPIHKGNGDALLPHRGTQQIVSRMESLPHRRQQREIAAVGQRQRGLRRGRRVWRKGYLALESEGSPVEFRNIRIQELPPTGATAENSAPVDEGWKPLYNGVDLRGWALGPCAGGLVEQRLANRLQGWGEASGQLEFLLELRVDRRRGPRAQNLPRPPARTSSWRTANAKTSLGLAARPKEWTRNRIIVSRRSLQLTAIGASSTARRHAAQLAAPGRSASTAEERRIEFGNIYVRTGKAAKPAG